MGGEAEGEGSWMEDEVVDGVADLCGTLVNTIEQESGCLTSREIQKAEGLRFYGRVEHDWFTHS